VDARAAAVLESQRYFDDRQRSIEVAYFRLHSARALSDSAARRARALRRKLAANLLGDLFYAVGGHRSVEAQLERELGLWMLLCDGLAGLGDDASNDTAEHTSHYLMYVADIVAAAATRVQKTTDENSVLEPFVVALAIEVLSLPSNSGRVVLTRSQ
jgi:hypothetical protein